MGNRWWVVGMVLAAASVASVASAAPVRTAGEITSVTLYRGQALVTRSVPLPAAAGELEIIVPDLPARIVSGSVGASAEAAGVRIRSVRYRAQAVARAPDKAVADLDAKIKQVAAKIHENGEMRALLRAKDKHLDRLEAFAAPTAQVEMSKGVLNPDTLAKISGFILQQREAFTVERIKLHQAAQALSEDLALLKRKRAELARGRGQTRREAVVFVSKAGAGAGAIEVSYLVGSANWSPTYNVRLTAGGKTVQVECLAQVSQMSGEDWPKVALTLSTATPATNAQSPLLVPMWVSLVAPPARKKPRSTLGLADGGFLAQKKHLTRSQTAAMAAYNTAGDNRANWELNRLAAEEQRLELNVKQDLVQAARRVARAEAEALAVSHQLPGRMNLASRSDRQLVEIARLELPAEIYHEAIPLLGTYVYRVARVKNTGATPLLAGPYSAYVGGEFVGRGTVPVVARGQSCAIGLGVDAQLRCRRELVNKSDKISWGSRVQEFHYRLRLENFKDHAVPVRLIDRMPATKSAGVVKISLTRPAEKLSIDPVYVRDDKPRGLLRWDLQLAAGAAGAKARHVDYHFEMKYAKDAHVGREAAGMLREMEADFRKAAAEAGRDR